MWSLAAIHLNIFQHIMRFGHAESTFMLVWKIHRMHSQLFSCSLFKLSGNCCIFIVHSDSLRPSSAQHLCSEVYCVVVHKLYFDEFYWWMAGWSCIKWNTGRVSRLIHTAQVCIRVLCTFVELTQFSECIGNNNRASIFRQLFMANGGNTSCRVRVWNVLVLNCQCILPDVLLHRSK